MEYNMDDYEHTRDNEDNDSLSEDIVLDCPDMHGPHQPKLNPTDSKSRMSQLLRVSWTNSQYPANLLNKDNVLDYFCNPSNVFYDSTCNNEQLRMQQRANLMQHKQTNILSSMQGVEYELMFGSEPLFVIRKQYRQNPQQVSPLADYYIIAGVVYQAPDLCSVINSRLTSAIHPLREAFYKTRSMVGYSASSGYYWKFATENNKDDKKHDSSQVSSTLFQRTRTHRLLALLSHKFETHTEEQQTDEQAPAPDAASTSSGTETKESTEPPAKRVKLEQT